MRELSCLSLGLCALTLISLPGCAQPGCEPDTNCAVPESETSGGDGDGDTTGDGDGDTTDSAGDGDGDTTDSAGDGDGDTTSTEEPLGPCWTEMPIVVMETSLGTMVVQLDGTRAPITVQNFIEYVDDGFYDGAIFHRVINNFVLQGGGFLPGLVEKETNGPIPLEIHPELRHVDGAIAMARSAEPDTAESQFYITDGAQGGLDDNYAVFGVLIDGFEVRNMISSVPTGGAMWNDIPLEDVPVEDVVLNSAYCVEDWP